MFWKRIGLVFLLVTGLTTLFEFLVWILFQPDAFAALRQRFLREGELRIWAPLGWLLILSSGGLGLRLLFQFRAHGAQDRLATLVWIGVIGLLGIVGIILCSG